MCHLRRRVVTYTCKLPIAAAVHYTPSCQRPHSHPHLHTHIFTKCRPKMEAFEKIGLYNKNIGIQSVYQNMIANIAWPITIESFHTDNWDCETAPEHGCCSSKGGSKGGHNKWSPDKGWICPPSVVHFWEEKPSLTRLTKNWSERFGGQLSPFHHHLVRNFCAWIETFWDWSWGRRSVPTSFCLQYHDQYFI